MNVPLALSGMVRSDRMGDFVDRLQSLMTQRGVTQKELAERTGITEASVSKYLNRERTPRIDVILNIAKAFGVSVDELMGNGKSETAYDFNYARLVLEKTVGKLTDSEKLRLIGIICGTAKGSDGVFEVFSKLIPK